MPFAEDLAPFFDVDEFATAATLNGVSVQAIVDSESVLEVEGVLTQAPTALLSSAQAASASPGQSFVAAAVTYEVRRVLREPPDGAMTRLVLRRG